MFGYEFYALETGGFDHDHAWTWFFPSMETVTKRVTRKRASPAGRQLLRHRPAHYLAYGR